MNKLTHLDDLAAWKTEILRSRPPFEKTIVVTSGTCGRASGSLQVLDALRREIDRRELADRIGIKVTGCHGFCEMEPSIVIYPEGTFYKKLEPQDVPAIIEETILNDRIISDLTYDDPSKELRFSRQKEIPFYKKQMRLLTDSNFHIDPERIEDYIALDGYRALAKALLKCRPRASSPK
jgi:NADH-quinone oxidoreductase subunit F